MTNSDKVRSAVAYVRVSSSKQADSGLGEAAQRDGIERWAAAQGLTVAAHADLGVSGRRKNRPTLERAIEEARRTRSPLVVYCLSRLARSTMRTLQIVERLNRAKVELVSIRESLDTRTAMGRMMLTMLAALGQMEAELAGERTSDALRVRRERGLKTGGALPFGYRQEFCGSDIHLVPDERLAWVIAEIRALREGGASLRQIATGLNSRGITTAQGSTWKATQVASVLRVAETRIAA